MHAGRGGASRDEIEFAIDLADSHGAHGSVLALSSGRLPVESPLPREEPPPVRRNAASASSQAGAKKPLCRVEAAVDATKRTPSAAGTEPPPRETPRRLTSEAVGRRAAQWSDSPAGVRGVWRA